MKPHHTDDKEPLSDRQRWDKKYASCSSSNEAPAEELLELGSYFPIPGRALDVAGGTGRHALWLCDQGWDVTLVDVSPVALDQAAMRATERRQSLKLVCADLITGPFPAGTWDLILCSHFLHRPMFDGIEKSLNHGGVLVVIHPTRTNLSRHASPPAEYLYEVDELPTLVPHLQIDFYDEAWRTNGRHLAVMVARRT